MIKYIKNTIFDLPEEITAIWAYLAADHLFTVQDLMEAKLLPEEQARVYHHTTSQLLFLIVRAQRDIQQVTIFLIMRDKSPNKEDWGKVKWLLGYLKSTINVLLILSADSHMLLHWWVDAAYAINCDCKGNTGAGTSFCQCMALSYS